jgi:hypothetical protein
MLGQSRQRVPRVILTIRKSSRYFLPDFFFAAQYALNLADNFALAAGLIRFFLAAALAEAVVGVEPRTFAHLAL